MDNKTPGPWSIHPLDDDPGRVDIVGGERGLCVAEKVWLPDAPMVLAVHNLLAELKRLEWSRYSGARWMCPRCGGFRPEERGRDLGHKADCSLNGAMIKVEG